MRRLFTVEEASAHGITRSALRWGARRGRWRMIVPGVWGDGPAAPTALDVALATVLRTGGVACGNLAGVLHGLDGVALAGADVTVVPGRSARRPGVRRRSLAPERVVPVRGIPCTDGLQTLVDLAELLDDRRWEQALESALRTRLVSIADLAAVTRARGTACIRRVLALRPPGAPPTESLLETLMVQLARRVPGLPPPARQVTVCNQFGEFVARVDLAWPDLGLFLELDGQHHLGQPVYDARRETAVVAVTGWFCGRFTWDELVRLPATTARRLADLAEQARRRPIPPAAPGSGRAAR